MNACTTAVENSAVLHAAFSVAEGKSLDAWKNDDWVAVRKRIHPESKKANFVHSFRRLLSFGLVDRTLEKESARIFNEYQATKFQRIAKNLKERFSKKSAYILSLKPDRSDISYRIDQTFKMSLVAKKQSKKVALRPIVERSLHSVYVVSKKNLPYGVFKKTNHKESSGEIGAYFISILCQLNFTRPAVPSYCWTTHHGHREREDGIFTLYEADTINAQQLYHEIGPTIFNTIPKASIHALCVMHMLRGSEDARMANTLLRLKASDGLMDGSMEVAEVCEIDNEHIMASFDRSNQRLKSMGNIAPLRIWWMGLKQAELPFDSEMLKHILSLHAEDFTCLYEDLHLFSQKRVNALISRLTFMQEMARIELKKEKIELSPREMFHRLCFDHCTIELASRLYKDAIFLYENVGFISEEELSSDSSRSPYEGLSSPLSSIHTSPLSQVLSQALSRGTELLSA